jgi:hypothetical protein
LRLDAAAVDRGALALPVDLDGALGSALPGLFAGLFTGLGEADGEEAWVEEADFEVAPRAARVALGPVFLLVFLDIAASITPSLRPMRLCRHDRDAIRERPRSPNAGFAHPRNELVDNRPIPQQHTRPKPWWRNW